MDPATEVLYNVSKDILDTDTTITTRELYSLSKDRLDVGTATKPR